MNKRILELYEQAVGPTIGADTDEAKYFICSKDNLNKFVQLIVNDCVTIAEGKLTGKATAREIQNHFSNQINTYNIFWSIDEKDRKVP